MNTMVIEDKGCFFVRTSIIAIIDSEPYDLFHCKIVIRDNTSNQNIKGSHFHSKSLANLFPMVDLSEYFVIYKPTNQLLVFCGPERHILDVISMKYMESSSHLSIRLIFITQTELQRP